ncbi:hypothetical protein BJF80_03740 [Serinicoccus sp. CUA-874]|nr:hypothetical protein BJF80_03740 [Serinicoccus sp. CUA-874]
MVVIGPQPRPGEGGGLDLQAVGRLPAPAPSRASSVTSAAIRSVSCPRRWAIPRSRLGVRARAHRAATTGVSSPTSDRSRSTPSSRPAGAPRTASPCGVSSVLAPMAASTSLIRAPGWVVRSGQSATTTRPPVTAARARKGAAEERSGSTVMSTARTCPGWTSQLVGLVRSTSTPTVARASSVISTWGRLGSVVPVCSSRRPRGYAAPARSSAETNCELAEASMRTTGGAAAPPPSEDPDSSDGPPLTTKGRVPWPSSLISAPSARNPSRTGPTGRARAEWCPSKRTGPSASAATGGTKRITVPA